ncbi:nitrile hydratase accessory protein [Roseibium marinum]|uniref:Nitrile hydratase accessory protein n=1 Tax=Roseibium marinum TaxID=281252 RepID=A0A2S3UXC2_9HYPH|nr:nitrile hydratase accessory protein [Roseibium marinum]POF32375.1 nitrile hydratase accessory protein [Roseibium marinum]
MDVFADLPFDRNGDPVFGAPWEARVFAMTVKAHEAGVFSWREWTDALGAELANDGENAGYYDHWLAAFETLLTAKGVAAGGQLAALRDAWEEAAHATPHGQPIELDKGLI